MPFSDLDDPMDDKHRMILEDPGKIYLTIHPDGRIELGEGVTPSEAARGVFELYEDMRESELATLRARVVELEVVEKWSNGIIERMRMVTDENPRVLPGSPDLIDELMAQFKASQAHAAMLAKALEPFANHSTEQSDYENAVAALTTSAQAAAAYVAALEKEHEAAKKQIALAGITCDGSSDDCPACNAYDELAKCVRAVEAARKEMGK